MTIQCCVCKRVLVQAGPEFPVSHTVGACCWDAYRAQLGLRPKAFPASGGGGMTATPGSGVEKQPSRRPHKPEIVGASPTTAPSQATA